MVMRPGLFAAVLGISLKDGLYPCLRERVGTQNANAVLDYAMFALKCKSDPATDMGDRMADEVLFTRERHPGSWYSELFASMFDTDKVRGFNESWLRKCADGGTKEAWIAIVGSDDGCAASCPRPATRCNPSIRKG